MLKKTSIVFIAFFITMFAVQQLYGASGKIEGRVTDATTGEYLYGASVIIEGTSLGAATDLDGKYIITNIPSGSYTLKVSYVGYKTITYTVQVKENDRVEKNIQMEAVAVSTAEVVVTAQASGQNSAINQQLASDNIVNVVSSTRIQALPDANAAESIGRLPGISLIRSGGQATKVVVRGLSPEFNQISMNGVPIPSNESGSGDQEKFGGGRGIDMRMISSSSLDGIEVYKTNTPDMDAAVLGGTINLGIRKAKKVNAMAEGESILPDYMPAISFQAQGGFKDLTNEYNNFKFDVTFEKRFFDEKLGVLVQGIMQEQNLTSDRLDADYTQAAKAINPDSLKMTYLNLYYNPRTERRYNGTITLDYDIPDGNIALTNIFSQSRSKTHYFEQRYGLNRGDNAIHYYVNEDPNDLNLITNILTYKQKTSLVDIDATFSHSYSENIRPDSWTIMFEQLSTGTNQVNDELSPVKIAELAYQHVSMDDMDMTSVTTSSSFTKQRELRAAVDLKRDFNIADFLSLEVKAGGMYSYTDRSYDYTYGYGYVRFGEVGDRIVAAFPYLTTDYGIIPDVYEHLFVRAFMDPNMNVGTFLKGDYAFDNKLNVGTMRQIKNIVVDYGTNLTTAPTGGNAAWVPDMFNNQARDYSGTEDKSAGYLMGTFKVGQTVTFMTGVRYQSLTTEYTANRFYNASASNPYPKELPHIDTTVTKNHAYWLPAFNIKYDPLPWLSFRGAYTNTLAYPNYRAIIPIIDVYSGDVDWNNVNLKPIRSENYDLQLSVYNNEMGLFTFGGFLKRMRDFVFWQDTYVNDPTKYEGLYNVPQYPKLNTKGYTIGTYYNNPNTVELWGIEADWQTHFWYLPGVLNGLVLNVNYTHAFSKAKYPYTIVGSTGYPYYKPVYTDSTYSDRLINQPDDIVNVSLGWDYKGFSALVSMIYQSSIFNSTDYWNANRTDKAEYLRWDIVMKQELPWYNMEVFMNLNNLNGENDTYVVRGNHFTDTDESYGLTAEMGFRIKL